MLRCRDVRCRCNAPACRHHDRYERELLLVKPLRRTEGSRWLASTVMSLADAAGSGPVAVAGGVYSSRWDLGMSSTSAAPKPSRGRSTKNISIVMSGSTWA
jgi:hypothetical protein